MMRTLPHILVACALLSSPALSQIELRQTSFGPIQLAQSTGDGRLQAIQPVTRPAPNTGAVGPVVRPYGSTGDDDSRQRTAPPPLPSLDSPLPSPYPVAPPNQGIMVPGGG